MSYNYAIQRPFLLTEDGQVMFLKIRDEANRLLQIAGAVRLQEAIRHTTGDSWNMLACLDRLVELGEIREIPQCARTPGQFRIFVKADE